MNTADTVARREAVEDASSHCLTPRSDRGQSRRSLSLTTFKKGSLPSSVEILFCYNSLSTWDHLRLKVELACLIMITFA
jgi:hypothetical protein